MIKASEQIEEPRGNEGTHLVALGERPDLDWALPVVVCEGKRVRRCNSGPIAMSAM